MDVVGKMEQHRNQITYMWIIDDFCDFRKQYSLGQAVLSPIFYNSINCKWQLKLWPQGITEDDKGFISLFVYYRSQLTARATISFSIIDIINKVGINRKATVPSKLLFVEGKSWGFSQYLNSDEICAKLLTLSGNKLIIKCEIELDDFSCIGMHKNEKEIDLRIQEYDEFEKLLDNNNLSDVTLKVDEKKIHAHKCILAIKSPVFAAMFEHDTVEKQCNEVVIHDVAPAVLKEMLRYIYVGRVNGIADIAIDLLMAANKYSIENLKDLCEEFLCDELSTSNAIEYVNIAENYNARKLKAKAIQYIVSHAEKIIDDSNLESYAELEVDSICKIFRNLVIQKVIKENVSK